MDSSTLIGIGILVLVGALGTGLLWYFLMPRSNNNLGALRGKPSEEVGRAKTESFERREAKEEQLREIKRRAQKNARKKEVITLEMKFFHAGLFSAADQRPFYLMRTVAPFVAALLFAFVLYRFGFLIMVVGAVLGAAIGYRLPYMKLDRKIKTHGDDILYYLPLVIEQIVIGVSSSLDIGPCVQRVVTMADERDSHNCVTEILRVVQHYMRSGVSMEDALVEIGRRSGHTELKHTFMSLAQVARHGGEVSKQLQELADAVSNQREAKIETKIKKLELEATLPVAMVFAGFLLIILAGFGIQIKDAFK